MIAMKYILNSILEPSPQILALPDTINVNFDPFPETAFAPVHGNQLVIEWNFFEKRISGHGQLIEETWEYLSKSCNISGNIFGCEENTICQVTVQTSYGKYLSAESDGGVNANKEIVGLPQIWTINFKGDDKVDLKGTYQKYLVAAKKGAMFANAVISSIWETFTVTRLENGQFSLKSYHGKYLIAKEDGSLNANGPSVVTEGMFLIALPGNTGNQLSSSSLIAELIGK